ncbi:MAG: NUDIX domain-containing protein [Saprospiraceae bacterium]
MTIIDKLAWIEIQNQHILSTRSKGKNVYYIPGGKRENGESDHAALIREIKEELSVELLPDSIQYVGTWEAQAHGHAEGVLVRMTCYSSQYIGQLAPASEIAEMVWLNYSDWDNIAPVDKIIFDWLKGEGMIQ